jgi:hypothetical protein
MSDLHKAAQQALEALEGFAYHGKAAGWPETITALRAALAQQAEPVEPVATVVARQYDDGTYAGNALDWAGRGCENDFPIGTNFYTSPPQPPAPPANQP